MSIHFYWLLAVAFSISGAIAAALVVAPYDDEDES